MMRCVRPAESGRGRRLSRSAGPSCGHQLSWASEKGAPSFLAHVRAEMDVSKCPVFSHKAPKELRS